MKFGHKIIVLGCPGSGKSIFSKKLQVIKERVGKERTDIPWTEQELDTELVELVENYKRIVTIRSIPVIQK